MAYEEPFFDELDFEPEESDEPVAPPWRRPLLIGIAAVTALAMALVPLYNVINRGQPVAENGLEVCGFDYCIVQEAAMEAGISEEMNRLANTFLGDEEAANLAEALLDHLGEDGVSFIVVDHLDRDIKGQYDPSTRTILVERPVRAWIVVHEVAHAAAGGHDTDFQRVLIELTELLQGNTPIN